MILNILGINLADYFRETEHKGVSKFTSKITNLIFRSLNITFFKNTVLHFMFLLYSKFVPL